MQKLIINLLTSVLLLGLFSNCKKDCSSPQPDTGYFIFGHFYGMCFGETCVEIFKIENGALYEDTTDNYPFGDAPYDGMYVPLSSAQYALISDLMSHVPTQLLSETDKIIGTPDAYDQGGYYFEIKESGNRKYWMIDSDNGNIPAYLHTFTDALNSYINRLQ